MNFLIRRLNFNISEAAKNWTIVKNKFIVPAKPKKPLSAFFLYLNQKRPSQKGSITQVTQKLAKEYQKLTSQQKQKYLDQAKKNLQKYKTQLAQYQSKYVQPFKTVNITALAVKKLFQNNKPKTLAESNKSMKQYFAKQTEEQKKKFEAQAQRIRKQKQQIAKQFLIPEPQFKSQNSFVRNQIKGKSADVTPNQRAKIKEQYQSYYNQMIAERAKFAEKLNLKLEDLEEIIKLHQRRLKRQDFGQTTINHLSEPQLPTKIQLQIRQKKLQAQRKRYAERKAKQLRSQKKAAKKTAAKRGRAASSTKTTKRGARRVTKASK